MFAIVRSVSRVEQLFLVSMVTREARGADYTIKMLYCFLNTTPAKQPRPFGPSFQIPVNRPS